MSLNFLRNVDRYFHNRTFVFNKDLDLYGIKIYFQALNLYKKISAKGIALLMSFCLINIFESMKANIKNFSEHSKTM